MQNFEEYYEEHRSELLHTVAELGYDYHTLVADAQKDNMSYKEYIVTLCT